MDQYCSGKTPDPLRGQFSRILICERLQLSVCFYIMSNIYKTYNNCFCHCKVNKKRIFTLFYYILLITMV